MTQAALRHSNDRPTVQNGPVLVLGGSGRLGRMLRLLRPHTDTDWSFQCRRATPWADLIWDGTRSDTALATYLAQHRPRAILNLIGRTDSTDPDTFRAVNVAIPAHILDLAKEFDVPHVALVSSAAVYGAQPDRVDTLETAGRHPRNAYGRSKTLMEDMALRHARRGPCISLLRIGNVAGADTLLSLAERGDLALDRLDDDSTPLRSYIGPRDLAKTLSRLMNMPPRAKCQILNVAHPQPVTLGDLLAAYRAKINAGLTWANRPAPANTIPKVVLNTAALQSLAPSRRYAAPAAAFAAQVTDLRRQIALQ